LANLSGPIRKFISLEKYIKLSKKLRDNRSNSRPISIEQLQYNMTESTVVVDSDQQSGGFTLLLIIIIYMTARSTSL